MILAGFSAIEKSYPSKKVLKGISGAVKEGERIAFLGSNGTGKTTLLEILAGRIDPDTGMLEIPRTIRRGYLPQEAHPDSDLTLFEFALGGLESLLQMKDRQDEIHRLLERRHDDRALLEELGRLQTRFEELGGYHIETRTGEILRGLGFKSEDDRKRIRELSGGMQNRAALARLLIGEPDLLLLDEPTNHLDIEGLEFLETFLLNFKGGAIYVSHDRTFIRNTATGVWELAGGRIIAYPGGYDSYLVERDKRHESLMKSYESQREFIARTEEFIRRNIVGQKTKQAKSRRHMLAKLERLDKPFTARDTASINFADGARSTRIVVKCERASFSYDRTPLLEDLDFVIERGERIGLFGPNGSGKTTIIRLVLGELQPISGSIEIGRRLSIGYYDQMAEDLDPEATPLSVIREVKPEWNEPQIRACLAKFLFRGNDIFRAVGSFSGGEQSRLMLARIIVANPNFLVLDEPTNHLDIQSREALESALADYNGTILCVSHDRQFLDSFAEKIFAIENGFLNISIGGYTEYKEKKAAREVETTVEKPESARTYTKSVRRSVNPQIIKKVTDRIESIEKTISEIETSIGEMETSTDWQRIWVMMEQRDTHYAELEKLYEEFERLTNQDDLN